MWGHNAQVTSLQRIETEIYESVDRCALYVFLTHASIGDVAVILEV